MTLRKFSISAYRNRNRKYIKIKPNITINNENISSNIKCRLIF